VGLVEVAIQVEMAGLEVQGGSSRLGNNTQWSNGDPGVGSNGQGGNASSSDGCGGGGGGFGGGGAGDDAGAGGGSFAIGWTQACAIAPKDLSIPSNPAPHRPDPCTSCLITADGGQNGAVEIWIFTGGC